MAFERFTLTGKSYRPKISIRSNGQIGFNQGAIERFGLNNYKFAVLFYDRDQKIIGIKLTNQDEDGACTLQVRKSNAAISAKAFLDYFDINYSKTKRYDAKYDEQEKMITAELNKPNKEEIIYIAPKDDE